MRKFCWRLGVAIDTAHLPGAAAILLFGLLWMPAWLYYSIVAAIAGSQMALRTCPLNYPVIWLKRRYQSDYQHRSYVSMLYERFGRWAALLIVCTVIGLSTLISWSLGGLPSF